MDSKIAIMSALLAGLLISSGLAVYYASNMPNEQADDNDQSGLDDGTDGGTPGGQGAEDRAPSLIVQPTNFSWGESVELSGWIVDESPSSTIVSASIYTADSLNTPSLQPSTFADEDGHWRIILPFDEPGTWLAEIRATDDAGQASAAQMVDVTLNLPLEYLVLVTLRYEAPEENETIGWVTGELLHLFTATCGVEFWPEGQSAIEGFVNGSEGTFRVPVDVDTVARQGELWVTCGLYDVRSRNITFQLPIPVEPPEETVSDQDGDGIVDINDNCPDTPSDEPVWPDGCSDSQLDSDEDGVTDDLDQCPGTPIGAIVDAVGCAESQKDADSDGVSDVGDQCPNTPAGEVADANGCSDSQKDQDGDGVQDSLDQCPNTLPGTVVGPDGCEVIVVEYDKTDSLVCTDGNGPWVEDHNEAYYGSNRANNNGVASAGGSGSGPWFQCTVSVSTQNSEMVIDSNGIPNHDFLSTLGCCADEMDYTAYITLNPVNDTSGGHATTNCPASAGRWECAPDRGAVAIGVNGVPIYGPEEGPGGDAVALHFDYFDEDRQPIELGWCAGHSAGPNGYHYHYDANCIYWEPGMGEDMSDYDMSKIPTDQHSPIVGWAFDGYPIYGMYGYDGDGQTIRAVTSSYAIERTQDGGDQGYNGIDDWNYVDGIGDLDECNGRFGPTPEFPDGIFHYVSTPLSGTPTPVTDTNGNTVGMIGFPYFLLCYHGVADVGGQSLGGGQGPGPGPGPNGEIMSFNPEALDSPGPVYLLEPLKDAEIPLWLDLTVTVSLLAAILGLWGVCSRRRD